MLEMGKVGPCYSNNFIEMKDYIRKMIKIYNNF